MKNTVISCCKGTTTSSISKKNGKKQIKKRILCDMNPESWTKNFRGSLC